VIKQLKDIDEFQTNEIDVNHFLLNLWIL
jgi:hypothetical protein